ncbi:MAG: hypothetical protein AAGC97_16290 [Planctomycetota bacterium]
MSQPPMKELKTNTPLKHRVGRSPYRRTGSIFTPPRRDEASRIGPTAAR